VFPAPPTLALVPEALVLGFASGSACLASCGVVLLPWLTGLRRGPGGTLALLGVYLGGRLGGYLVFGLGVGLAGARLDLRGSAGLLVGGLTSLAVGTMLGVQAWRGPRPEHGGCPAALGGPLDRRHGLAGLLARRQGLAGLALLGLLTGLNLCGPFVAATLRAAQAGGPLRAMLFFLVFFVGTAVWTLPLALVGLFRRWRALAQVARLTLGILAVHYTCFGALLLLGRWHHA